MRIIQNARTGAVVVDEDWEPTPLTAQEQAENLAKARAQASLTRFELASAAATAGYITFPEATQWAAGNAIPTAVQTIINALPIAEQGPVTLDVLTRPIVKRTGNLMPALATAFGTNDAGLDALFGIV